MSVSPDKSGFLRYVLRGGVALALLSLLCTCGPAPGTPKATDIRLEHICPGLTYGDGTLDVSPCVFDSPRRVPLHRNWRFHWQTLPDKLTGTVANEGIPLVLLNFWNRLGEAGHRSTGYATYTSTIVPPVNGVRLGVVMPDVRSSYALYANGQLLAEAGRVGTNEDDYFPGFGVRVVALPAADTLRLSLAVANFSHRFGGIHRAPHLGAYEYLREHRAKQLLKDTLFQSLTFFIGVLNLLLFLYYRRERVYLFFGLTALAVLLRQLSVDSMLIFEFFPDLSWKTVQNFRYVGFYLGILFGGWYYHHLFPKWIGARWVWGFTVIGLVGTLLVLVTPTRIGGWSSPVIQASAFIIIGYGLIGLFRAWQATHPDAGISLLALGLFLLVFLHDLLVVNHLLLTPQIIGLGFIILVWAQIIVLARRYRRVHQRNEELGVNLATANRELEDKVANRTAELAIKTLRLEEVNRFKEKMVRMVVHDMKNPLGVVLNVNRDKPAADNKRTYLAAQRMEKLVQNFLKLSEYETGQLRLQPEPCALNDILDHVDSQLSGLREQHGVELVRDYTDGPIFVADEPLIERVLLNLIANAVAYSPVNSRVVIRYFWREDEFYLEVEDRGRGIAVEQRERIFQEFVRLEERRESTGLGLAFCKVAIESHGGNLDLTSELGVGTTFFFTLPGARPSATKSGQRKVVRPRIRLSVAERDCVAPFLPELLATPMYRITRFQELIDAIDCPPSEAFVAWKQAVLTACYGEAEDDLVRLLSDMMNTDEIATDE